MYITGLARRCVLRYDNKKLETGFGKKRHRIGGGHKRAVEKPSPA